jgi:hypothetical protein
MVDLSISRDIALGSVARALGLDIRSFAWVSPYSEYPSGESDAPISQPAALYAENGGADDRVAEATRRLAAREREIGELRRKLRAAQNRLRELEHGVATGTDTRG